MRREGRVEERGILKYIVDFLSPLMPPCSVSNDKYVSYFMLFAHPDFPGPIFCRYLIAWNRGYNIGIVRI